MDVERDTHISKSERIKKRAHIEKTSGMGIRETGTQSASKSGR